MHAQLAAFFQHDVVHLVVLAHALLLDLLGLADVGHQLVDLAIGGAVALDQVIPGRAHLVDQRAEDGQLRATMERFEVEGRAMRTTSPSLSPLLSRSALRTLSSSCVLKALVLVVASRP